MKRVTLVCDVADEDVEGVVQSAKEALPTWKVYVRDSDDIRGYYKVDLSCPNCLHTWETTLPHKLKVSAEVVCPNCRCKVRSTRAK